MHNQKSSPRKRWDGKLFSRTPEAIAEAEKQQAEAIEAGTKLGWTIEDAKKWAGALLRWRAAGYPQRTDEEVIEIVEICIGCKHIIKQTKSDARYAAAA